MSIIYSLHLGDFSQLGDFSSLRPLKRKILQIHISRKLNEPHTTLPTVTTDSVLLTSIVNAKENKDIAVIYILNVFIQTRFKEKNCMVTIKLRGVLVDILIKISPKYKPYVTRYKKGIKQFLVRFQNALYGTMISRILY